MNNCILLLLANLPSVAILVPEHLRHFIPSVPSSKNLSLGCHRFAVDESVNLLLASLPPLNRFTINSSVSPLQVPLLLASLLPPVPSLFEPCRNDTVPSLTNQSLYRSFLSCSLPCHLYTVPPLRNLSVICSPFPYILAAFAPNRRQ